MSLKNVGSFQVSSFHTLQNFDACVCMLLLLNLVHKLKCETNFNSFIYLSQ